MADITIAEIARTHHLPLSDDGRGLEVRFGRIVPCGPDLIFTTSEKRFPAFRIRKLGTVLYSNLAAGATIALSVARLSHFLAALERIEIEPETQQPRNSHR